MAVVKNTFSGNITDDTTVSTTITGLSSETSSSSVNIYQKHSLHLLNAIYQTLLDAGYSDVIKDEINYSITVLGFKLYIYINNSQNAYINASACNATVASTPFTYLNKGAFSYNIVVRGDKNCVGIWLGQTGNTTSDISLITIAKAKNLITGEDAYAFFFNNNMQSACYCYFCNKSNIYDIYRELFSEMDVYRDSIGLNNTQKQVIIPLTGYNHSFYVYSLYNKYSLNGTLNYYKIGEDIYCSTGERRGNSLYAGYTLMKVS